MVVAIAGQAGNSTFPEYAYIFQASVTPYNRRYRLEPRMADRGIRRDGLPAGENRSSTSCLPQIALSRRSMYFATMTLSARHEGDAEA